MWNFSQNKTAWVALSLAMLAHFNTTSKAEKSCLGECFGVICTVAQ